MLHLANIMQYEDDFDDQNLYVNKNKKRAAVASSSDEDEAKPVPKILNRGI
jgi:hypothetical protein